MFEPVTDSRPPLSSKTPYPTLFETVSPVIVVGPLHAPERFTAPHPATRQPSTSTDVTVRPLPAVARTPATRSSCLQPAQEVRRTSGKVAGERGRKRFIAVGMPVAGIRMRERFGGGGHREYLAEAAVGAAQLAASSLRFDEPTAPCVADHAANEDQRAPVARYARPHGHVVGVATRPAFEPATGKRSPLDSVIVSDAPLCQLN